MHILWETVNRSKLSHFLKVSWQEQTFIFSERLLAGTDMHIFWETTDRNRHAHFLRYYWQDQTCICSERLLTGTDKHIFWANINGNTDSYSQQATVFTAVNYKRNECALIRIGQKNNILMQLLESIKVNLYNSWRLPDNQIQVSVHIKIQKVPKMSDKIDIFNTRNRMGQGLGGIYYEQFSKLWL